MTNWSLMILLFLLFPAIKCQDTLNGIASSHLKYMSYYGFDADVQHSWSNLGGEGTVDDKIRAYEKYGLQSLYGPLPEGEGGIFIRNSTFKGLAKNWQETLENLCQNTIKPLILNKTILGVFFGDEICCAGVPFSNLSSVVNKTRQLLGPDALLYTNECSEMASWSHIPIHLDLISMDIYGGYYPGTNGTDEVKKAQDFYNKFVFPKLSSNQQAMLVPGTFACSNTTFFPLAQQDENVRDKLQSYFDWAKSETRIAGFNPWHFHNRSSPQHGPPCDMQLGIQALPQSYQLIQEIGKFIINSSALQVA